MGKKPLPVANVIVALDDTSHLNEEHVRGMICNPIYTGVPPFPRILDDETWIAAAEKMIREEGATQFLVNLLHVLHVTYHNAMEEQQPPDSQET